MLIALPFPSSCQPAREPRWDSQVLDLSKIEAGKLELNPQTVQFARLIDEVIGTRQLAEQNKNRLVVEVLFDLFGSPSWIHIGLSALIQTEKFSRYSKECGSMIGSAFDQGRVPSLQGLVPHAIDTPRQPHI
jgi:hypothetical protein